MSSCLIISGGDYSNYLPVRNFDMVIAVDRGVDYAQMLGITPNVILGDFDSVKKDVTFTAENQTEPIETYVGRGGLSVFEIEDTERKQISFGGANVEYIKLPKMKDDSDTLAAARYALGEGYTEITLTCIFGGRFDHMLANLQVGSFIAENGGTARFISENDEIFVFKNQFLALPRKEGYSLSVFALSDECRGLSIKGALYDVENMTLTNNTPQGLSNQWASPVVVINVAEGILAVVISKM